ncbi:MAG: hypothetical protein WC596_00390 [Candidatus Shapirobacteria bacterium]
MPTIPESLLGIIFPNLVTVNTPPDQEGSCFCTRKPVNPDGSLKPCTQIIGGGQIFDAKTGKTETGVVYKVFCGRCSLLS